VRRPSALTIGWLTLAAVLVCVLLFILAFGSASDGNPRVVLDLQQQQAAEVKPEDQQVVEIPKEQRLVSGNLVADPALIEESPLGPLPKIAADGRTPRDAYGRASDKADTRPRVAIVLLGVGISNSNTTLAISRLPPGITLAFPPFGGNMQNWVDQARGKGHEVLLEVPMEPFDFPDSDPGPNALLVGASGEENGKRLEWSLSRYTGYAGITNLFGGRFLGETAAMEPILQRVTQRGLFFFDTGASPNSVAPTVARHQKTPFASGSMTLDVIQSPDAIDSALNELEALARQQGWAVGIGEPYPISVDRIADWAASLEGRGIVLVPVSALAAIPSEGAAPEGAAPPAP